MNFCCLFLIVKENLFIGEHGSFVLIIKTKSYEVRCCRVEISIVMLIFMVFDVGSFLLESNIIYFMQLSARSHY